MATVTHKFAQPIPILFHESYFTQFYGAQVGLYHLLRCLDRTKFSPLMVCPGRGLFTEKVESLGIEVVVVPLPSDLMVMGGSLLHSSIPERISQLVRVSPQVWQLAKLIRGRNIQLMHCDLTRSVLSSGWAAKLTGIPLIWHLKGDKVGLLDDIAFVLSDKVISVSENIRAMLCKRWKIAKKVVSVRDGVPLERFDPCIPGSPVRHEWGFDDADVVIGIVASLGPRKGHTTFIRMAETLATQCPAARFVIVGDVTHEGGIAYKEQLLQMSAKLVADGRLVFAGWRNDMPAVYAAMDVFTLTSEAEGLPLAMLEAMAMGKPTISSMTVSANELVVDEVTGYLVPIRDAAALADAVRRLVYDQDRRVRMGAAARDRALSIFSAEKMARGVENVFLATLGMSTRGMHE